jgi:hypothetical protein
MSLGKDLWSSLIQLLTVNVLQMETSLFLNRADQLEVAMEVINKDGENYFKHFELNMIIVFSFDHNCKGIKIRCH